jgi:2-iminobutanoate/2-iminopropanoate deaminase
MNHEIIFTDKAPQAVGPYSQGVRAGDFVFVAGQLALDPETGKLIGDDIISQTRHTMRNIAAVLEAANSSLDLVVKTTVFLRDIGDFKAFNAAYAEFFPENPPARLTVGAGDIFLGALVEIEAIALVKE